MEQQGCPFCDYGSSGLCDRGYSKEPNPHKGADQKYLYYVECQRCGAKGHMGINCYDALTKWNIQIGRKDSVRPIL